MGYIKYGKYIWGEASSESKSEENEAEHGQAAGSGRQNGEPLSKEDLSEI
jgi:hypothetical protein